MSDHHHGTINHDQSEPHAKGIFLSMIITSVVLFVVIYTGVLLYKGMSSTEVNSKEENSGSFATIQDLHVYEEEQLNTLKWIDQPKGKVQVPISVAMAITLKKYQ